MWRKQATLLEFLKQMQWGISGKQWRRRKRSFTRNSFCGASYLFCTIHSKLSLLMGRWQHCICTKMQHRGEFSQYFVCATVATEYQSVDGNADKQRYFFFRHFFYRWMFFEHSNFVPSPNSSKTLSNFHIISGKQRKYALAQCNKPYWKRIFVNLILSVSREGKQKSS